MLDHPGDPIEHRALALWVQDHDPEVIGTLPEDRRPPWSMVVRVPASPETGGEPMYFLARGYLSVDDIVIPDFIVTEDLGDENHAWLRIVEGKSPPESERTS